MIFPGITFNNKVARIELSLANLQLFTRVRTHFFNVFKFSKSRNRKNASFSLRNLFTRLHLKFHPKLRKNYQNIAFRGRSAANCPLMADRIRVAQPIRLQHLH